jgi:hypothetical protein
MSPRSGPVILEIGARLRCVLRRPSRTEPSACGDMLCGEGDLEAAAWRFRIDDSTTILSQIRDQRAFRPACYTRAKFVEAGRRDEVP